MLVAAMMGKLTRIALRLWILIVGSLSYLRSIFLGHPTITWCACMIGTAILSNTFGLETDGERSLAEFLHLVSRRSKVKKCTLQSLTSWLVADPRARIVTDVKDRNLAALIKNSPGVP